MRSLFCKQKTGTKLTLLNCPKYNVLISSMCFNNNTTKYKIVERYNLSKSVVRSLGLVVNVTSTSMYKNCSFLNCLNGEESENNGKRILTTKNFDI